MNLFNGLTFDWGFQAVDIFTNGMIIVGSLAAFILLGLAIRFVPELIYIIRDSVIYKNSLKESYQFRKRRKSFFSTEE